MKILLGSANKTVIKRWEGFLSDNHQLEQAGTFRELVSQCNERKFELSLLHRPLIDRKGFSELAKSFAPLRFFLFSDKPTPEEGIDFLKLGIVGYGNTYMSKDRLTEAVRVISDNGVWLGQKVVQQLILESRIKVKETAKTDAEQRLYGLTKSERVIASMVAKGLTNLEIAADLNITERTVKAHLTSIYEKTKTGNRLNLALLINRG
ncbi:MAG: response regulator transcription factor [Pseudomonadota bacterium]